MHVRFWGTRGSIATPGWKTAKFGGNTSCVEVRAEDGTIIVLDCGTGARELGRELLRSGPRPLRLHLFIGHTHWDHIQGFPFFAPAFLAGAEVNIYAPLGFQKSLGAAMAGQMESSYFPVKLKDLRSHIHFTELDEGFFRVGDVLVETQYLNHTAPTIAYRLSTRHATVAYAADHEPFWMPGEGFLHPGDLRHVGFLRDADLLIHDAQYTHEEYKDRLGWGHSPIEYVADVALAAGARRLALFHHDPSHDDRTVETIEGIVRARVTERSGSVDVFAAAEGLALEVKGYRSSAVAIAAPATRRTSITGRRVLIVDDDEAEIASLERELADDGLVLGPVADARSVLGRAVDVAPDLVIVSRELVGGDGVPLIGSLRSTLGRPDLPVIVLTDGPIDWLDGGAAAPTDYVARPFSPPMLRARIRAWLSRTVPDADGPTQSPPGRSPVADGATADRVAALLSSTPLFRGLSPGEIRALATGGVEEVFAPGAVIVREGSVADGVFVVLGGRVRVLETARDTQSELVLNELGDGEMFGEIGALRDQLRVATVVAVERTHCLVMRPANFIAALQQAPDLSLRLLRMMAGRLSDANRRVARYAPDPLTSLMGRRAFVEQYRRLAAGARRRGTGILLMVLDVRELRVINDRAGYAGGDEVLRAVAEALIETTRTTDVVARSGGDEFAVLFVDTDATDVDDLVTRVQARLSATAMRHDVATSVACSIGVAYAVTPPEEPDELFRDADLDLRRRRLG